jgi:hypothetical protein
MKRRTALISLACLPFVAHAQPATAIAALEKLVSILGSAGEAISKFTKGITEAVKAGAAGYDYVAARRDRSNLIDISAKMTTLVTGGNMIVIDGIESYISFAQNSQNSDLVRAEWQLVVVRVREALYLVKNLLDDVKETRSDFVAQDAYMELHHTLNQRGIALGMLSRLAAPSSPEELEVLTRANTNYKVLVAEAKEAIKQLNLYIREQDLKK